MSNAPDIKKVLSQAAIAGVIGAVVVIAITVGTSYASDKVAALAACAPIALLGLIFVSGDDAKTQANVRRESTLLIFSMVTLVILFSINHLILSQNATKRGRYLAAAVSTVAWVPIASMFMWGLSPLVT